MKEKLFKIQNNKELKFTKDGKNPHFKNEYITLDNLVETLKPVLEENRLCVFHTLEDKKLITVVVDVDKKIGDEGEFVKSEFPIAEETIANPQKVGSAITYAKRYNLGAIFNIITDEDDDGNTSIPKEKVAEEVKSSNRL